MLTEAEVKKIVAKALLDQPKLDADTIKDIVSEAVKATLTSLGVATDTPLEMQADFQHLRKWRRAVNQASNLGFITIITTLTAGVLGAVWMGIQVMLGKQ